MSCFAVIPWSETFSEDRMFNVMAAVNRDNLLEPYLEMKQEFERCGHVIHTIDLFSDYQAVDFFLFFSLDWDIVKKIIHVGKGDRMVYCMAEPPSVYWYNSPKGYRILKYIFPYLLSWNDDWVDNKSVFKRNTPYWFKDQRVGNLPYEKKKLITCISGNKSSTYPGELYSERVRAIDYFEKNHAGDFDLYGTGWNEKEHPCYKGRTANKTEVYHQYRFAICYENIEGLKGYITEKLPDCLVSGIVPIYSGSTDVAAYVPDNCYIRLRDYRDYDSLYEYISGMDEDTYNTYLFNADAFLKSSMADYFSGARYANYILDAVARGKCFRSSRFAYKVFKYVNRMKR